MALWLYVLKLKQLRSGTTEKDTTCLKKGNHEHGDYTEDTEDFIKKPFSLYLLCGVFF